MSDQPILETRLSSPYTYRCEEAPPAGPLKKMVRMSARSCVANSIAAARMLAFCVWPRCSPDAAAAGPSRPNLAVAAPLVHGWPEKRSRLPGGSSLEFHRSPAGPRGPVRGWRPAAAARVAAARQIWRPAAAAELAVQRTHQQSRREHPSLTPPERRSSRTASSPSRTPRSAASARC